MVILSGAKVRWCSPSQRSAHKSYPLSLARFLTIWAVSRFSGLAGVKLQWLFCQVPKSATNLIYWVTPSWNFHCTSSELKRLSDSLFSQFCDSSVYHFMQAYYFVTCCCWVVVGSLQGCARWLRWETVGRVLMWSLSVQCCCFVLVVLGVKTNFVCKAFPDDWCCVCDTLPPTPPPPPPPPPPWGLMLCVWYLTSNTPTPTTPTTTPYPVTLSLFIHPCFCESLPKTILFCGLSPSF